MMKILHVCQRYWPSVGGSEKYIQEISERFVRLGHEVTVFTTDALDLEAFWDPSRPRVEPKREAHNGVEIIRFPIRYTFLEGKGFSAARRMMATLAVAPVINRPILRSLARFTPWVPDLVAALRRRATEFDVIHGTNVVWDSLLLPAVSCARKYDIPFALTPLLHLGEGPDSIVRAYYTMPHQIDLTREAEILFALTTIEADYLASRGVERSRIVRTGAGVNPSALSGGEARRFRHEQMLERPLVAYIGACAYDKGTVHLVAAMQRIWESTGHRVEQSPDLVLAGAMTEPFKRFIEDLPSAVCARIHRLGVVDDAAKRDLLDATSMVVMPSRTDSFGIVFLEAWLYQKPVIGARAGGIPAVIDHGTDGYLVEFGDVAELAARIAELLANPERARRLGERGREKVMRAYTWDKLFPIYEEVYNRLCLKTMSDQAARSKR
jgi:glycosyltransferase involved in cell wall biosynthesis